MTHTPPLTGLPRKGLRTLVALLLAMFLLSEPAAAQHNFQRTLTVDKSGSADFTTIQAAINSLKIGFDPTVRFTVLIYPGNATEHHGRRQL